MKNGLSAKVEYSWILEYIFINSDISGNNSHLDEKQKFINDDSNISSLIEINKGINRKFTKLKNIEKEHEYPDLHLKIF